jgi:hypothetical protein
MSRLESFWWSTRINKCSPYLTGDISRLRYRAQPVNAVWGNSRCLLWEPYGTQRYSPYLTGDTSRLHYRVQPVNAVWGNNRCLLWEPYGTQRYTVGSSYLAGDTSCLHYRAQPVNAVWGNCSCLLWEQYGTHRHNVWAIRTSQETHHFSTTEHNRLMLCGETVAVCCENRMEHSDALCGQSVPHRRHITSPLQSTTG